MSAAFTLLFDSYFNQIHQVLLNGETNPATKGILGKNLVTVREKTVDGLSLKLEFTRDGIHAVMTSHNSAKPAMADDANQLALQVKSLLLNTVNEMSLITVKQFAEAALKLSNKASFCPNEASRLARSANTLLNVTIEQFPQAADKFVTAAQSLSRTLTKIGTFKTYIFKKIDNNKLDLQVVDDSAEDQLKSLLAKDEVRLTPFMMNGKDDEPTTPTTPPVAGRLRMAAVAAVDSVATRQLPSIVQKDDLIHSQMVLAVKATFDSLTAVTSDLAPEKAVPSQFLSSRAKSYPGRNREKSIHRSDSPPPPREVVRPLSRVDAASYRSKRNPELAIPSHSRPNAQPHPQAASLNTAQGKSQPGSRSPAELASNGQPQSGPASVPVNPSSLQPLGVAPSKQPPPGVASIKEAQGKPLQQTNPISLPPSDAASLNGAQDKPKQANPSSLQPLGVAPSKQPPPGVASIKEAQGKPLQQTSPISLPPSGAASLNGAQDKPKQANPTSLPKEGVVALQKRAFKANGPSDDSSCQSCDSGTCALQ